MPDRLSTVATVKPVALRKCTPPPVLAKAKLVTSLLSEWSVTVPLACTRRSDTVMGAVCVTAPPLIRPNVLAPAGLIGWLIEILPLVKLPILSVPAVIRSSSVSVRPSDPAVLVPRSTGRPVCSDWIETVTLLLIGPCKSTFAPLSEIVPLPAVIEPP